MTTRHADDATLAYIAKLEAENAELKADAEKFDADAWAKMFNDLNRVEKQRDDLLAAAERVRCSGGKVEFHAAVELLYDAIERCKEN